MNIPFLIMFALISFSLIGFTYGFFRKLEKEFFELDSECSAERVRADDIELKLKDLKNRMSTIEYKLQKNKKKKEKE